MKKFLFVILILGVAAISSAATVGVMKYMEGGWGSGGSEIIIVSDKRCAECNTDRIKTSLERTLPNVPIKVLDYGDRAGKKLYEKEKLDKLPAVLLSKGLESNEGFAKLQRFAKLQGDYYTLMAGGKFDPTAEICGNKKDDNNDGKVDCDDPTCKSDWQCMEKKGKPSVDVFVMSHCPYGTQIEKGVLPVWDLFGDKIDLNIRFVDYAMHGKKEVDEQLKQYCIQKMDRAKYRTYLECFLKDGKEGDKCLSAAGIDQAALKSCIAQSDKEFGISKDFADKAKWKGRFPPFAIDADKAKKYGVRGSPTLVVNDVVVKSGRSPKAIQDAICKGFKEEPAECKKPLDAASPSPGFGFGKQKQGGAGEAKCGG